MHRKSEIVKQRVRNNALSLLLDNPSCDQIRNSNIPQPDS